MNQTVLLPIPPTVGSQFVVLAPDHLPPDLQPVLERWARRVRAPCVPCALQESNLTIVAVDTAALGDPETLLRAGNPPALVRRVRGAEAHLLVACDGPSALPISPALVSFGIANDLALATGALLFDPLTCEIAEPDRQVAGMEVDLTGPPIIPVRAWVRLWEDDGRVRTRGMPRFGLPDLSTRQLPPDLAGDWSYVLAATGSVLIRRMWEVMSSSPQSTFLELHNPLMLWDHHVHAEAFAAQLLQDPDRPHRATPVGLQLDFDPADDSTIELCRPAHFAGTHEEWLRQTASFLLKDVRP